MTTETPIQTVAEAEAIERKLSIRRDALEQKVDDATSTAASDISALADGSPVNTDEIVRLKAELRVLDDAIDSAREGVKRAQHLAVVRATLERKDKVNALIRAREQLALDTSLMLDQVAEHFAKLVRNGHDLVTALAHGRERIGPHGYIAVRPADLLRIEHLASMLDAHFACLIPGWRIASGTDGYARSFSASCSAVTGSIENELDTVGGFHLTYEDEQLVRADMRREQKAITADNSESTEQPLTTGD